MCTELCETCRVGLDEDRDHSVFKIWWVLGVARLILKGLVFPKECRRVAEVGIEAFRWRFGVVGILMEELARPPVHFA